MTRWVAWPAAVAIFAAGCTTTYYAHHTTQYGVTASGGDFGPRGDEVRVSPGAIEFAIAQSKSNVSNYYQILTSWEKSWPSSSILTKQAFRNALLDLDNLNARLPQAKRAWPGLPKHLLYARLAGQIIAPHAVKSIQDHGYARIAWGHKLDKPPEKGIKPAPNQFYITAHKDDRALRLHQGDLHSIFGGLEVVRIDLAKVDAAFGPGASATYDKVAASAAVK